MSSVAETLGMTLDDLPVTLSALTERAAERAAARATHVAGGGERVGYGAIPERAARLAGGLHAWGVMPGDRVALWMRNRPEWLDVWFAVNRLGATLVPLNTRLSSAEAEYVLRQSRTAWLVRDAAVPGLDDEDLGGMESRGLRLCGDAALGDAADGHADARLNELAAGAPRESAETPELIGMIQYTSGSTAFPKGAMLRNASLIRNGFGLGEAWQITAADRVLCANPLFHCGGSVFSFMAGFTHGAAIVLLDRWRMPQTAADLRGEAITVLPIIDAMARDLLAHVRSTGDRFPALRLVSTAADPELFRSVATELRCEVSNVYGLTESSPNVCIGDLRDPLETRIATIGRPQPGLEVEIRDPRTRQPLPTGDVGVIAVRGWSLMTGYFEDPEATAATIDDDGYLWTGDLGSFTDDGYLRYEGRLKQMIKSGGENVSIEEVERALRAVDDVADAVVVPAPDERFGEVGYAFVRIRDGCAAEPDHIVSRVRSVLAGFKVPKHVEVVDELPLTGSGKIDRRRLQDHARQQVVGAAGGAGGARTPGTTEGPS